MDILLALVVVCVLVIVAFDYTNGFHDVSNIVATMIASGAMGARQALLLAAFFEFLGPVLGGTAVANTIGKLIDVEHVVHELGTPSFRVRAYREGKEHYAWKLQDTRTGARRLLRTTQDVGRFLDRDLDRYVAVQKSKGIHLGRRALVVVILAAVVGAISWNLLTWLFGLPSSSSHALVGGLLGATLVATRDLSSMEWGTTNFNPIHPHGVLGVVIALVASPLIGFVLGFFIQRLTAFCLHRAKPTANVWLKRAQWVTSSALAFSHGTNDGQKSMGVITLVLVASGYLPAFRVPLWVKLVCASAITLGVASGGWRIMKTLGRGIFKLKPIHGFSSQFTSAGVILGHSFIGGPVSTTHVVTSTVMGIGTACRKKAVRWGKVSEIALAWAMTVPAAAVAGALLYFALSPLIRFL